MNKLLYLAITLLAVAAAPAAGADTETQLAQACKKLQDGNNKAALSTLDAALNAAPRFAAGYLHRAIARSRLQDAAGAGADYREALKSPAGSKKASVPLRPCSPELSSDIARLKKSFDDGQESKKKGIALFLKGDASAAIAKLNEAVKLDPSDPEMYASRAVAWDSSGKDPEKAAADYRKASETAAAAGRWDLAAETLLNSLIIKGTSGDGLAAAVVRLDRLIKKTTPTWEKRADVLKDLKDIKEHLKKTEASKPAPKKEQSAKEKK